ncbi:SDR family NAD(P)-dependent oxidoreductase [Phenylobacterium sp. LjRoot225]|uniref:SDR family NAD(P)-dependent oxidoreductase n=1 Tax=Phenylobacterium sp. LjRoot225 TaxID=3342285 RepID=UPI003ED0986B
MVASGRVALVTGGGSGMGEATSHRLAREGMAVGVLDIDSAAAERVAAAIRESGGRAIAVTADISVRREVKAAIDAVRDAFGPIAILINNAAIESFTAIEEIDEDSWDRLMSVNLKGAYIVIQTVLADMTAAGWGRIVNVSAIGAQSGATHMAHYTAAKGGLIAMTKSLAIELGARGITVNSVSPGFILTPMSQRAIDANLFPVPAEQIYGAYPIPRLGRPEEIAAACAYLVSDDAGYVTGQVLAVNGGAYV